MTAFTVRHRVARALRLIEVACWWVLWPAHRLWCARFGHDLYSDGYWEAECYRCGLLLRFVDDD